MLLENINELVNNKLDEIEKEYKITISYAVEAGSRAYGYASENSDFDVRFIYRRRAEDYLRLDKIKDTIEICENNLDISGWDISKTLIAMRKSSQTVYEWIGSPITYRSKDDLYYRLGNLMQDCYSEQRIMYHYVNMARNHMKTYLSGDTVSPKKYLCALRPALAALYLKQTYIDPPVEFCYLRRGLDLPEFLNTSIDHLLNLKINHPEISEISPMEDINTFISNAISEIDQYLIENPPKKECDWEIFNEIFLNEILPCKW